MRLSSPFCFCLLLILLSALGARRYAQRYDPGRARITFFDVGQGDSALLELPGGKTILVDAGGGSGEWDMGSRELFPELARLGILRLDVALLSHPDQDHGYGFLGLFRLMKIGELWMHPLVPMEEPQHHLAGELEALAVVNGTKVRRFHGPATFLWKEGSLTVWPLGDRHSTSNNRSLVLSLDYGGCRALFTGDMEAGEETAWLEAWRSHPGLASPHVTLLKVAHHGSRTSSTESWLEATRPRWAVISVGWRNHYGHPAPSVLTRLRNHGAQIFRTDFHGYVQFSIDASGRVFCRTAQGDCGRARCSNSQTSPDG